MDEKLKKLQETICCGCPYGADSMETCGIRYCDKKEAFNIVMDAYKNVKKEYAKYISVVQENAELKLKETVMEDIIEELLDKKETISKEE